MSPSLLSLLRAVRAGDASALPAARAALRAHAIAADLPITELFEEDPRSDAAILISLLCDVSEATDALGAALRDAVDASGSPVPDVSGAVLAAIGAAPAEVLAAVRGAAGAPPAVADAVMAALDTPAVVALEDAWPSALLDGALTGADREAAQARLSADSKARAQLTAWADQGRALREALADLAGPAPSLWGGVAEGIGISDPEAVPGWRGSDLGDAVRAAAGEPPSVVTEVMARVQGTLVDAPAMPRPANRTWRRALPVAMLASVAAVMFAIVPRIDGGPGVPATIFAEYAHIGEAFVDDLHVAEGASVLVELPADDEATLFIWIDEGSAGGEP